MPSTRMFLQPMLPAAMFVAITGIAPHAWAHTLSVTRGTATIEGDTLTVTFEPNKHGHSLLTRLSICDAQGERLSYSSDATIPGHASAKADILRYALAPDTRYVSFQLLPPSTTGATHVANVALAVRVNGEDREAVRLAGSGNVEVVRIAPVTAAEVPAGGTANTDTCELRRKNWFVSGSGNQSVRSIVSVEDWGVEIELLIPTPVMETWTPIARAHRDFIERSERKRALAKAEAFIMDRFDVRVNGSRPLAPTVTVTFLDLADPQSVTNREPGRLSAWSTGLRFSLRYHASQRPDRVALDWKLFNAIVLTANAMTVTPGGCDELDFSTYTAHWSWQRR